MQDEKPADDAAGSVSAEQHKTALEQANKDGHAEGKTEGHAEGVAAENARIMGIMNCDEAKGRESIAQGLAEDGLTVEAAQKALSRFPVASVETQTTETVDTETNALDTAIEGLDHTGSDIASDQNLGDDDKAAADEVALSVSLLNSSTAQSANGEPPKYNPNEVQH